MPRRNPPTGISHPTPQGTFPPMTNSRWTLRVAAALTALVVGGARLSAQVTTGTVVGTVTNEQGQPVDAAQIRVQNRTTGFSAGVSSRSDGRFTIPGLEVGSNYSVTVRRIGFQPQTRDSVSVSLGQATRVDFQLKTQAAQIAGVVVTAETQDNLITPTHQGAVTTVTDSALRRLPTLNRNFTDFVALTPQVSTTLQNGGLSGGGTNNRYNSVQIDGTTEADVFGLGSTGQPGGQAGGKSIGIESVKEYQVLLSPYDVRQGNFAGVLINAVTKSGTNEWHGSVYGVGRNQNLTRTQPYLANFKQSQYGFALGGPIVQNKAFFFVNPEFQTQTAPASGVFFGQSGVGLTSTDTTNFQSALQGYGFSAGDVGTARLVNNENPLQNVFARLDFNLPGNNQLVIRDNYGHAEQDIFSRTSSTSGTFGFSSNGYKFKSTKNAPALQLRSLFSNGMYNELLTGLTQIRDRRAPNSLRPQITVNNVSGFSLVAGAERFSQGNELDQDIYEITDNFTLPVSSHRITVGTQNQFFKFRNLFTQASFGVWTFGTMDSLVNALPKQYVVGVPLSADGAVRFKSRSYSAYVQDEWTVSSKLNVQAGVRLDKPDFTDKPPVNQSVLTLYNRNTASVPDKAEWSPRLGFNYDVTGDGVNQLRGGVGMFAGRPAYVWLSNAFQNSGSVGVGVLTCNGSAVPAFSSASVAAAPQQCSNGLTAKAGGEIDLLDPNLKLPQNLRATLGYDRRIGDRWVATVEALYTRGVNGLFYRNIALSGVANPANIFGKNATEDGRWIYGSAANKPDTLPGGRNQIFDVTNQSKDHAYNLTGGIQRRFFNNFEGSAFYTYSRAWAVQDFTSSTAFSQYRFGRAYGFDQTDNNLQRSIFEQRHRIVAQGTYSFRTKTDLSVVYFGEAGTPYGYVVNGDPNGDGVTLNDPIYVPKNATDANEMTFVQQKYSGTIYSPAQQAQAFENFIKSTGCLSENRGKLLPGNACTNPWTNTVNVSIRQSVRTLGFQNVSFQVDVFNFMNLVNSNWGLHPSAGFGSQSLLDMQGVTGGNLATGRPTYSFNPNYKRFLSNNIDSNYRIQLQMRYSF